MDKCTCPPGTMFDSQYASPYTSPRCCESHSRAPPQRLIPIDFTRSMPTPQSFVSPGLPSPSPNLSNESATPPSFPNSPNFGTMSGPYQFPGDASVGANNQANWLVYDNATTAFMSADSGSPFKASPGVDSGALFGDWPSLSPRPENQLVNPVDLAIEDDFAGGSSGNQTVMPSPARRQGAGFHSRHRSVSAASVSASTSRDNPRKRKSSAYSRPSTASTPPPAKATAPASKNKAHNMIEKRYRNNLNDKIMALRDAVPSLRVRVSRRGQRRNDDDDDDDDDDDGEDADEDLQGLAPAHKLNKATILGKATEYIAHLEKKNRAMGRELSQLRQQVGGLEKLVFSRGV